MRLTFLLFSLVLCLIWSSELSAQTASETEGCAPLFVNFTPPAGANAFFWDFDNGSTSVLEDASTTFTDPGTYEVAFSEGSGQPVIGTVTITVFETPDLSFEPDTTIGCAPFLVNFTNNSNIPNGLNVNTFRWTFGDGTIAEVENPAHTYQMGGLFNVSLQVITDLESCNVTEIQSQLINVSDGPNTSFTTDPAVTSACNPPLSVNILNTTTSDLPASYEWDLGNGNTFSGENPPSQIYTEEGNFSIVLTATDENGCVNTASQTVSIGEPFANFEIPDTVCLDEKVTIINLSDTGFYNWDLGPNVDQQFTSAQNPMTRFRAGGLQDITLSVTTSDGSCTGDTTITIFVDDPDPSFVSDPSYSCSDPFDINYTATSPDAVDWIWIFYDNEMGMGQNVTDTYIDLDTTTFSKNGRVLIPTTLVVTNASGCRDTLLQNDTIYQPNALYMPDVIDGCVPLTVTFSDSSDSREDIVLWEFDYGDGTVLTFDNDDDHTYTYTEPGIYETVLNIENEAGCVDTSYVLEIRVGEPIDISFNGPGPLEICPGDTVTLSSILVNPDDLENVDAWHFETDNSRSFHCFQEGELEWVFETETGPMDVSLTVEHDGCQNTITEEDYITVKGPIARIDYLIDCENPLDVTFRDSSYDATSITWDFGDGTTSMDSELIHTYAGSGDYTVILTAENASSGCAASSDTALVCVRQVSCEITLDTILCAGVPYVLDASNSLDIHADCWKGYEWSFDISGRPITSQEDSIDFTFPSSGSEVIQLVGEDINGCTDTTTLNVEIYRVDADFEIDDNFICTNGTIPVNFTDLTTSDTTLASWNWSFGSSEQNPSHIFTDNVAPGDTIFVTLNVTDIFNCPSQATDFLTVYQPFSAIISDPFPSNICVGDDVTFQGIDFTGGGSNLIFDWDFGNSNTGMGTPVTETYNDPGTFNVTMTFTEEASGCSGERVTVVNVQETPTIDFSFEGENDPIICGPAQISFFGDVETDFPVSYSWTASNGETGTTEDVDLSFDIGTFDVQFIVSTVPSGCADTINKPITLVGPQGDFELSDIAICDGEIITFSLVDTADISSFTWDFGDGASASDIAPVDHLYEVDATGQRTSVLTLKGANDACETEVSKTIDITKVIADFTTDNGLFEFCADVDFNMVNTSIGANEYAWDFGDGNTSNDENPGIAYSDEGTYPVTLIATESVSECADSITQDIVITSVPIFGFVVDTICKRDTALLEIDTDIINITPSELEQYQFAWNVNFPSGTFLLNDTLVDPGAVASTDEDIELTVTITDPVGCTGDLPVTIPVYPLTECIDVLFPNVFTPNGDNRNEFFNYVTNGLPEDGDVTVIQFKVYSRWGQLVYDNDRPLEGWDGTFNGEPSPSDVYIYKAILLIGTETRNVTIESQGDLTLIR